MNQSMTMAILAVAAVALLGVLMRRAGNGSGGVVTPPIPVPEAEEDADGAADGDEAVAVTSDGWTFLPVADRDRVQLIPPLARRDADPIAPRPVPEQLARGDLIAARVRRGAPDHDPWRLEALGRDHDYRAWRFETEEAARAALALISRSIVAPPRDAEDADLHVGDEAFAAARRREEEIESELATMPEVEEGGEGEVGRPLD